MRIRKPLVTLAVVAVAAAGTVGTPALAATATWTVTPGRISGANPRPAAMLTDSTTGFRLTCPDSGLGLDLHRGSGLGPRIGDVSYEAQFCYPAHPGPGVTVFLQPTSPKLHAVSYDAATGETMGSIPGIRLAITGSGCTAEVEGPTAGALGTLRFTYTNATGVLSLTSKPGLAFQDVSSGCAGVLDASDGDAASFHVAATMSPVQTITSP